MIVTGREGTYPVAFSSLLAAVTVGAVPLAVPEKVGMIMGELDVVGNDPPIVASPPWADIRRVVGIAPADVSGANVVATTAGCENGATELAESDSVVDSRMLVDD